MSSSRDLLREAEKDCCVKCCESCCVCTTMGQDQQASYYKTRSFFSKDVAEVSYYNRMAEISKPPSDQTMSAGSSGPSGPK